MWELALLLSSLPKGLHVDEMHAVWQANNARVLLHQCFALCSKVSPAKVGLRGTCMADTWLYTRALLLHRYHNIARRFFEGAGMQHVVLMSADGALEAAPAMGSADIILDLVSTGVF